MNTKTKKQNRTLSSEPNTTVNTISLDDLNKISGGACSHAACSHAGEQPGVRPRVGSRRI